MARIVPVPTGGYQVRWYDGRRNARGKLIETGGQVFDRKPDATAEKRRVERAQRVRREVRQASSGRVLSIDALLEHWRRASVTQKSSRASYQAEKVRVLTALAEAQRWHTVVDITPDAIGRWRASCEGVGTDKPLQMLKTLLRHAVVLRQPVDPGALLVPARRRARRPIPTLLMQWEVDWCLALAQVRGSDNALFILDHLATYGCRPVDACKVTVGDFNAAAGELTLRETKNGETVTHPLLPRHVERYVAISSGRLTADRLFLNPYGEPWRVMPARAKSKVKEERAGQLTSWYKTNVAEWLLPATQRGIYCLKDFAISSMDGRGIDDRTKALFTGHKTLGVFARYKATNKQRARHALGLMA